MICPTTGDKIWITTATLADLKKVAKTGECPNSKRKQLVRITSKTERLQRYQEAAEAIQAIEQKMLPPYGGRPWRVTCRITEPNTRQKPPLFRWFRGRLELACAPHLLEKIPDPPRFKGAWAFENQEEEEAAKTSLQERVVSSLSTAAWLDREHAIPNIKLKWLSPNHTYFYSRKAAWEHAAVLAEQDVFLDKVLLGLGARGQELRPTKVTKALALKAGKLRFLRDGLWVVGQEESWQEERAEQLESSQEQPSAPVKQPKFKDETTPHKLESKCQDIETVEPSDQPLLVRSRMPVNNPTTQRRITGLVLYLRCNRERHRAEKTAPPSPNASSTAVEFGGNPKENKSKSGFTLHEADCELRAIWRGLGHEERQIWEERARNLGETNQESVTDEVATWSPCNGLTSTTRAANGIEDQASKDVAGASPISASQTDGSSNPDRQKAAFTGLVCFLKCNRQSYQANKIEEHAAKLRAAVEATEAKQEAKLFRYTLRHADMELRQVWKSMPPEQRAEWHRKAQELGCETVLPERRTLSAPSQTSSPGRVTPSESSSNDEVGCSPDAASMSLAKIDVQQEYINSEPGDPNEAPEIDLKPASTAENTLADKCEATPTNETMALDVIDYAVAPVVEVEQAGADSEKFSSLQLEPTAADLTDTYGHAEIGTNKSFVDDGMNGTSSSSSPTVKRRRRLSDYPPRRFNQSSYWRMSPEHIELCYDAAMSHFEMVMHTVKSRDLTRELEDGFDVLRERGRGRYDMELPIFDTSAFDFLNDLQKAPWMPVVREILGEDVVLIHKGVFLSLPGAEPQAYHQDGPHLTTQTQRACHAINVFIPLVDLSPRHGPTQFCLGSHILGFEELNKDFLVTPTPTKGTPIIFDYRLGHKGLGNTSSSPRPLVYCTYAAAADGKEFRDSVNFSRKRYRKIGELVIERPLSRDERRQKRQRQLEDREIESVMATIASMEQPGVSDKSESTTEPLPSTNLES